MPYPEGNRAHTNFTLDTATEGAPLDEQKQAHSAEKRVSAALRMARAELSQIWATDRPFKININLAIAFKAYGV